MSTKIFSVPKIPQRCGYFFAALAGISEHGHCWLRRRVSDRRGAPGCLVLSNQTGIGASERAGKTAAPRCLTACGGRSWWAQLEITRMDIELTILKREIEEPRTLGALFGSVSVNQSQDVSRSRDVTCEP